MYDIHTLAVLNRRQKPEGRGFELPRRQKTYARKVEFPEKIRAEYAKRLAERDAANGGPY